MANAADTPRSDAASHDFDVEAVLLERERRGLRIPAMARVLFTSYAVLAILSAAPGDVRAIGLTIVGVVLVFNLVALRLLRDARYVRLVGYAGAVLDALLIPAAATAWSMVLVIKPVPPGFLFKTPLTVFSLVLIIFNSLPMRPIYPLIVTTSGVLTQLTLLVLTSTDPRTVWAATLRETFHTNALNPMLMLNMLVAVGLAGGVLVIVTHAIGRALREATARQAEHLRMQRAQVEAVLEGQMQAQRRLVAGISHEMNTPLGAVTSSISNAARASQRLRESIERAVQRGEIDERLDRLLGSLADSADVGGQACDRLAATVQSLRRFTQLDKAEEQLIDINGNLDQALAIVPNEVRREIAVERRYGELPTVYCSPSRLNQVFVTLLTNAFEAIDGDGVVTVSTEASGDAVRVEIADSGRGMTPEALQHLFEVRWGDSGKRVSAGFGLAACQIVMRQHAGDITAQSSPGKGTKLTLVLPVARSSAGRGADPSGTV
ncbi:MAG: HAMP domain-containing histidine kinase [Myxococcales bacterium]|nr:HAMP domain-containing histidine kinase [Myxococcales bacterium]